jgi:hypothetical protein
MPSLASMLHDVIDQIRHKISLARLNEFLALPKKRVVYHDWKVETVGDDIEVCWDDLETTKWAGAHARVTPCTSHALH